MRKTFFIVIVVLAGYAGLTQYRQVSADTREVPGVDAPGDTSFGQSLNMGASGGQLQGQGTVIKVLPDDNDGSRHQKFILKLSSGQTVLIAHNIDIAPRIGSLRVGDRVAFNGEFARNDNGGVIHWTHHDPSGRHVAGWLKHGNRTYQ